MLEEIGGGRGKVISTRALAGSEIEVSLELEGLLLGVAVNGTVNYVQTIKKHGTLYAEGIGVLTTDKGTSVRLKAQGTGRLNGGGAVWAGAVLFNTTSPKLIRLNRSLGVAKHDVDEDGESLWMVWEWMPKSRTQPHMQQVAHL